MYIKINYLIEFFFTLVRSVTVDIRIIVGVIAVQYKNRSNLKTIEEILSHTMLISKV